VEPQASSTVLKRWADVLRERGLEDLGILLIKGAQVWGFVGGQVLWMLTPFLGKMALTPLAEALETPEALNELQVYLLEGKDGG